MAGEETVVLRFTQVLWASKFMLNIKTWLLLGIAQSAAAVEYADYTSAEG